VIPVAFCIPGRIDLPTGGYRYDREVMRLLPAHGVAVRHAELGEGFPHPTPEQIADAMHRLHAVDRARCRRMRLRLCRTASWRWCIIRSASKPARRPTGPPSCWRTKRRFWRRQDTWSSQATPRGASSSMISPCLASALRSPNPAWSAGCERKAAAIR
jgi:hypothetical protein